jgi:hypothetical protein
MRRIGLTVVLMVSWVLAPLVGEAQQQPGKVCRIGFLGSTSPTSHGSFVAAFQEGLREHGYIEAKDVTFEYHGLSSSVYI